MGVESGFSVLIATHNRREKLRHLLESLRRWRSAHLDGVVVIDDSDEVVDLGDEFEDLGLTHIHLEKRVFLSKARNIAWHRCTSRYLFFIDDDNVVVENTLEEPFRLLLEDSDIGAIMPAVVYRAKPDLVWVYATPLRPDRWGHSLIGRNLMRAPALENRLLPTDALPNAFVVRRAALEEVGGFDERFVMSGSADFAMRLKKAGWKVEAYSGAFTLHDVEPPGRVGYWASHRGVDPERVFYDVRDWFILMRSLHPGARWFRVRATRHAVGFMVPNALSYLLRGGSQGRESLWQLVRAYVDLLRNDEVS